MKMATSKPLKRSKCDVNVVVVVVVAAVSTAFVSIVAVIVVEKVTRKNVPLSSVMNNVRDSFISFG
jgi:hypothetical protein